MHGHVKHPQKMEVAKRRCINQSIRTDRDSSKQNARRTLTKPSDTV